MGVVAEFHKSRRMFCIINGRLVIAKPNLPYSHIDWFRKEGWIKSRNSMKEITRGFVDKKGSVYFYTGNDFRASTKAQKEFLEHLPELAKRLKLKPNVRVFGGMRKQAPGKAWTPKKRFGTVRALKRKLIA